MHNKHMALANELAAEAFLNNEIPVGAVIVLNNEVIATGRNNREENNSVFGHAEINAISQASNKINSWKLDNCNASK